MTTRRASKIRYASPEALFMFGGEDQSPIYPQDLAEIQRWGVCVPFDRGAAAIERMQHMGYDPISIAANLVMRDAMIVHISNRIVNAGVIEEERQKMADVFNSFLRDKSVDLQG